MRPLLFGFALVSAACTASVGGAGTPEGGAVPRDRSDGSAPYELELLSPAEVTLSRGMSATLRARYLDPDGRPAMGPVYFDLEGDAPGAGLQAAAVETDGDGVAEVDLRAGSSDSAFDVRVSADYAEDLVAHVTVTEDGAGDLRIVARYEGERRVYGADVYLYADAACDEVEPAAPPPADRLESTPSLREDARVRALESGSRWSVLVLGIGEGGSPVVVGCASDATIEGGAETVVEVTLAEIPVTFAGPFNVESHFAITDSLPPDARDVLGVLSEIADDPNDPATYLLDLLGDQIDSDILRFAYVGARAALGIDEAVNDVILDWMPGFVWDALQAGDDLASALEDAQVDSILTVDEPAAGPGDAGTREARHELVDLVLELDGVTHRFNIGRDLGVNDTSVQHVPVVLESESESEVRLGAHDFQIGLGTLARFAMNEVVLPRFDGGYDSLAEFVAEAMPCEWIGDEVAYFVGVGGDDFWAGLCELGAGMMGQYAENSILQLDDRYDTLSLEGTAQLGDETKDLAIDALDDGDWSSALAGPAGRLPVAGTFEGRATNPQASNR
jgi:hypothetical protein